MTVCEGADDAFCDVSVPCEPLPAAGQQSLSSFTVRRKILQSRNSWRRRVTACGFGLMRADSYTRFLRQEQLPSDNDVPSPRSLLRMPQIRPAPESIDGEPACETGRPHMTSPQVCAHRLLQRPRRPRARPAPRRPGGQRRTRRAGARRPGCCVPGGAASRWSAGSQSSRPAERRMSSTDTEHRRA